MGLSFVPVQWHLAVGLSYLSVMGVKSQIASGQDVVKFAKRASLKEAAPHLREACVCFSIRMGEALEEDPADIWMLIAGSVLDMVMDETREGP